MWQNRCLKGNIAFVLDWEKRKNRCHCTSSLWQVSKFSYHLCMSYEQIFDGYVDTPTCWCWCWWIRWYYDMLMLMDWWICWYYDMLMLTLQRFSIWYLMIISAFKVSPICYFRPGVNRFYNYSSRKIVNCKIQIAQHFFFCQARMCKCYKRHSTVWTKAS